MPLLLSVATFRLLMLDCRNLPGAYPGNPLTNS